VGNIGLYSFSKRKKLIAGRLLYAKAVLKSTTPTSLSVPRRGPRPGQILYYGKLFHWQKLDGGGASGGYGRERNSQESTWKCARMMPAGSICQRHLEQSGESDFKLLLSKFLHFADVNR